MSATETVRVTADHIARGVPQEGDSCPIALAIKEQWGAPVDTIEVLAEGATVYAPGGWYSADEWPDEAARFVGIFDGELDGEVVPFEFTVTWHFQPGPDEGESSGLA